MALQIDHPFEEELEGVSVFCLRCSDYLCHTVQALCNHVFCRQCIQEYLLYLDECPICKIPLRNTPLYSNHCLDAIIVSYLQTEPHTLQIFKNRLKRYKNFRNADKISNIRIGMHIDVRDADYIWTTAVIASIKLSQLTNEPQMIGIRYRSGVEEEIDINLSRIALEGIYTNRKDIPHYSRGKVVMEKNGIYYELKQWKKSYVSFRERLQSNYRM